jgi:uridine kinase
LIYNGVVYNNKQHLLFELISKIEKLLLKQKVVVVSLDGRSGAGKSTLASFLVKKFDGVIINCDDFYAGAENGDENNWYKKTIVEKFNQVIDYQRLKSEVLNPLLIGKDANYHPFDFEKEKGLSKENILLKLAPLVIIDGIYSGERLRDLIDISVLVECADKLRKKRLIEREGDEFMKDWHSKWDEVEDYYFNELMPKSKFDFVIEGVVDK